MEQLVLNQIKNKSLFHAYLIIGSREKRQLLIEKIRQELNISESDYYFSNEESIKISHIRQISHFLTLKPHSSSHKLVIIENAAGLTLEASNALLKTLEEPSEHSILILSVENEDQIIPTIQSRCQKIRLSNFVSFKSNQDYDMLLDSISSITVKEKFDFAKKVCESADELIFMEYLIYFFRNKMLANDLALNNILKKILYYKTMLNFNTNPRLVIENTLLLF